VNATVLSDGTAKVCGSTNLFDNTNPMLSITGKGNYRASCKATVIDGIFEFETLSKQGAGLDVGEYSARITLSISSAQPKEFVKSALSMRISLDNVKRNGIAPGVEYGFVFSVWFKIQLASLQNNAYSSRCCMYIARAAQSDGSHHIYLCSRHATKPSRIRINSSELLHASMTRRLAMKSQK